MKALRFAFVCFVLLMTPMIVRAQETGSWFTVHISNPDGGQVENLAPEWLSLQIGKTPARVLDVVPFDRRQVVVLFDLTFSSIEGIGAARQTAWDFLSSLSNHDVAAIAVYDAQNGVRLQCSFTGDKQQWIYALNRLEEKIESHDAAGFFFPPDAHQGLQEMFLDASAVQAALVKVTGLPAKTKIEKASDDFSSKLTAFAQSLNTVIGEKEVVFFSPGVPSRKATSDFSGGDEDRDPTMGVPDTTGEVTELSQSTSVRGQNLNASQALARGFSASGCVVHTVDISKLGKPATAGDDYLKTLAKQTGGVYTDDPAKGLDSLKTRPVRTWLVSWRATLASPQAAEIKVTSNKGHKITHAPLIQPPKSIVQFNDVEKRLFFSQWLYNDLGIGNLQHKDLVDFFPVEENLVKTVFFLQIPGPQLLELKSKTRSLYIVGYLTTPEGKMVDYIFTPLRIDTDKTADALRKSGIKYFDALVSPPGDYRLKGAVIDVETNTATGFGFPFRIPDFKDLMITKPVIAAATGDWIVLRHEYEGEKKRNVPVSYPYEVEKGIFFPDLSPALQNGSNYSLYYRIYNLSLDAEKNPMPQFQFRLQPVKGDGTPISEIVIADRKSVTERDFGLLFQFKIAGISAGNYQLVTELTDAIAKKKITRQVSVQIQ